MKFPANFVALAGYNQWVNAAIYAAAATLSDAERKRDLGAFFPSLHATLNHNLLGDKIWLGRLAPTISPPYTVNSLREEVHADFAALRAERATIDARIVQWVATFDEMSLEGTFHYHRTNGTPTSFPMLVIVTHFFNHQTHHRGQMTTLLKQLGVEPGELDLLYWPGIKTYE